MSNIDEQVASIWNIVDLIRGTFMRGNYQDVIFPLTMLYRINYMLQTTKENVLNVNTKLKGELENLAPQLRKASGYAFYNTSPYDLVRLLEDPPHLVANLRAYINGFSDDIREILENFDFNNTITKLDETGHLFLVMEKFKTIDLNPDKVSNLKMWYIFGELMSKMHLSNCSLKMPNWLINFIMEYLKGRHVKSILDPWADSLLLLSLAEATQPETALGFIQNMQEFGVVSLLNPYNNITWRLGEPLYQQDGLTEGFDLIVSCLPIGLQPTSVSFDTAKGSVVIKDNREAVLLLQSCTNLQPDGLAFFVVANNFMHAQKQNSVYANLERFGLTVDAALSLPAGTFAPITTISTTLVIIRRQKTDRLFVGEVTEDRKRNTELLKNLKARKPGSELPLGALIDRELFYSYSSLVAYYKVQELAEKLGIEPVSLSDIAVEINFTEATEYPGFKESSNAIYLPLVGRGHVIASLSQSTLKQPSSYVQIVLDPNKAVALYVAEFFNKSLLGQLIREQVKSGVTIPRISKRMIAQMQVYLPDYETQINTIDADTKVVNRISELSALQERVWSQPRQLEQVLHDIEAVNRVEHFSDWLDTLPFPLASILWTYHSKGEDQYTERYRDLLHFFEALAEFLAIILLSGFDTYQEVFQSKRQQLPEIRHKASSIKKSTFGTWVSIAAYLAKVGLTMLNGNEEDKSYCSTMFRTGDKELLETLFSGNIISLLQQANEYRNSWVGHGGIDSFHDSLERHFILANLLSRLRSVFSTKWQSFELIKAGTCRFSAGIYYYRVEQIIGHHTPFKKIDVKTDIPMEDGQLYLLASGERTPLKLLPLVKVMPSPKTKQDVCYFYNRSDRDGIRFVSYYFEADVTITSAFEDVADILQKFLPHDEKKN